jgi:C-terminal processing protease CtpA/Prc
MNGYALNVVFLSYFNRLLQEVPEQAEYEDTSAALGGVGITFIKDSENQYIVNLLVKWGPAHKCKQIRQGDKLVSIDGLDVQAGGRAGLPLVKIP